MIEQVAEVSGHVVFREHLFHISTGTACQSSLYRSRGKTDPQLNKSIKHFVQYCITWSTLKDKSDSDPREDSGTNIFTDNKNKNNVLARVELGRFVAVADLLEESPSTMNSAVA